MVYYESSLCSNNIRRGKGVKCGAREARQMEGDGVVGVRSSRSGVHLRRGKTSAVDLLRAMHDISKLWHLEARFDTKATIAYLEDTKAKNCTYVTSAYFPVNLNPATAIMADAKTEVMQQVRQQAALSNARALVEVSFLEHSHVLCFAHFSSVFAADIPARNSMNTASNAASPSPDPRFPRLKRLATHTAWRSSWHLGTLRAGNT